MGREKKKLVYPIPDVCPSCKYYALSVRCCDYISFEGHSRSFNNKGQQVRYRFNGTEYCDSYIKGDCRKPLQSTYKEGGLRKK